MEFNTGGTLFGLIVFGLSLLYKADGEDTPNAKRYYDKPFPRHNIILGRNVTCEEIPQKEYGRFASHTWTCKNIRVNGARIAYGYYHLMSGDNTCTETGGKHEFPQLCRELLQKVAANRPLHALYIPEASCDYIPQKRALLNKKSETVFEWMDMKAGNGWVGTLQCMVILPETR